MTSEDKTGNDAAFPVIYRDGSDPEAFYEAVWGRIVNKRRDTSRKPHAVVRASSAAHVRQAVELAGRENCRISIRSGGHSWAGWSVRQDAVLIDLGELKEILHDEQTNVVSCSPSTTGQELNTHLATYGRMFAGGHCPDVGLGGFLLQGGMGWNCKNWGWACESVKGIDVVTADARELYCSMEENADLFWAARGSGPGFPAVVTRFYLHTRPLLSMFNCMYIYPLSEYRNVLQWVVDTSRSPRADPDTEMVCLAVYPPGQDDIHILAGFTTFKHSQVEAEKAFQRIHDSRPGDAISTRPCNAIVEVFCDPTSLEMEYGKQAAANPENHRYCSENAYIANEADVPAVLEEAFTTLPNKKSFSLYFAMNPTSRRPLPDMALSMQSDHYFALYTVWEDAESDESCTGWVHDIMRKVERSSVGSYLGDADFQERRTKFWDDESGKKLMELRRKWDPTGRICGFLDAGDKSGVEGLRNEFEWKLENDV